VVEFALVLPILLVVTLAVVQVGLVARDQLMVVQASRAGARGQLGRVTEPPVSSRSADNAPYAYTGRSNDRGLTRWGA
jgi:Flp pilus assembly protein TadG